MQGWCLILITVCYAMVSGCPGRPALSEWKMEEEWIWARGEVGAEWVPGGVGGGQTAVRMH